MNLIVCFGKRLNPDGSLDWINVSRCDLAVKLFTENQDSKLLLSGGGNMVPFSEAEGMLKYIKDNNPDLDYSKITTEDQSRSTIDLLINIKTEIILPAGFDKVIMVSDVMHIKRIEILVGHIFGPDIDVEYVGSTVNITGKYLEAMEDIEKYLVELTSNNPVLKTKQPGDHQAWKDYENQYQVAKKKAGKGIVDINDSVKV